MFCIGSIIRTVYECRACGATQAFIVTQFMRSIDSDCPELSNEAASNIARGTKNPSGYVMEKLTSLHPEDYNKIALFFQNNIVPLIKETKRPIVTKALILMIQEQTSITDNTVVEVITGTQKQGLNDHCPDLAILLAGLFIFALKNTKNNINGGVLESVKAYIEKAELDDHCKDEDISSISSYERNENKKIQITHIQLLEEENRKRAVSFCQKYSSEIALLPLCQIANVINPTRLHSREMYNEFCSNTDSTRRYILQLANTPEFASMEYKHWGLKLDEFITDYINHNLGEVRLTYLFRQYLHRLLNYRDLPISRFLEPIFPVVKHYSFYPENYKWNLIQFIEAYLYYKECDEYKNSLEPPMDYLWREFSLGECPESALVIILGIFLVGACRSFLTNNKKIEISHYSPTIGLYDIETAEDLFYYAVLVLNECYPRPQQEP